MFREDIRTPDGQIDRRQRKIRLGSLTELPTKNAARNKLVEFLRSSDATVDMTFQELTERWTKAEGPTMKPTPLAHYQNALRAYVLPRFGMRKIGTVNREDIQMFLAEQASKYSESSLRSMRVVIGLTFEWANACGWLEKIPAFVSSCRRKQVAGK